MNEPKILVIDIETLPVVAYVWGLWDQNIGVRQIKRDRSIAAWTAKWLGTRPKDMIYRDNRRNKKVNDDKQLVKELAALLNEADIVISKNGERFDMKIINARAAMNGLPPIKPVAHTDIEKEGRKVFGFTSHSLEYTSQFLNKKYKKLNHKEYPGFELWRAILDGDKKAWKSMERYNKHDVLATEEQYLMLQGWIRTQNVSTWLDGKVMRCPCGSDKLRRKGYAFTPVGKFQIYLCKKCGKWPRSGINLLSKEVRANILRHTVRH